MTETTQWKPIATAPKDGTEILIKACDGLYLGAFHAAGKLKEEDYDWIDVDQDGFYQRAGGHWNLYDSFAMQSIHNPTEWMAIP